VIAASANFRITREKEEVICNGSDNAIGNVNTVALDRDEVPDLIEFGFCFRGNAVSH